jgi:hypothetical protein
MILSNFSDIGDPVFQDHNFLMTPTMISADAIKTGTTPQARQAISIGPSPKPNAKKDAGIATPNYFFRRKIQPFDRLCGRGAFKDK